MERELHGFVFSNHALDRLKDRSITQAMVVQTLQSPDKTFPGQKRGTTKFIRNLHQRKLHVVASYLPDQNKWLIVSVWVRGEEDQVPIMWQLITLPFKLGWWFLRTLLNKIFRLHIQ